MWDVVVAVVQLACVIFLFAGAVLSLWFHRFALPQPREAPTEVKTTEVTVAVVERLPRLKRAA